MAESPEVAGPKHFVLQMHVNGMQNFLFFYFFLQMIQN